MKILVLCKRLYTGKDLLSDRYGRLFELPEALARRGHEVDGIALSYRAAPSTFPDSAVRWRCADASPRGVWTYVRRLAELGRNDRPDVVWTSSDVIHAVVASSFGARALLRRSCRRAAALTVVSDTLRAKVVAAYQPAGPTVVIGNGVRTDLFRDRDRRAAREALGLPVDAPLIGTVGSISDDRGIGDLFRAFDRLVQERPEARLVLAGPLGRGVALPRSPRVHWLGLLPHAQAAVTMAALDVVVVCNRDSTFGRACYPLKLAEAIASRRPVVAAAVGDVAELLRDVPASLYVPGDDAELATALGRQLDRPHVAPADRARTWEELATTLADVLRDVAASGSIGGQ